jgi:hypothetical protein
LVHGSVINRVIRRAGPINVQVMSHETAREAARTGSAVDKRAAD